MYIGVGKAIPRGDKLMTKLPLSFVKHVKFACYSDSVTWHFHREMTNVVSYNKCYIEITDKMSSSESFCTYLVFKENST